MCKLLSNDPYFIVKLTFQAIICKLCGSNAHTRRHRQQETKQLYIEIGMRKKEE